ncbi:glycosyl hydrolase family 30 TIM-barrel domain-containing protein [Phthorimaea operculella]|nr:glycosyl hydrolase family 30 TIM-barrel domain-containing protein [Phthorimaea operculella]
MIVYVVLLSFIAVIGAEKVTDKPCAAKLYPGESVVCVCNATYCDDITRETLEIGQFITYTSTESGLRLQKAYGKLKKYSSVVGAKFDKTLTLHPGVKYQKIEGFGGAVTDSAGINWKSLSEATQQKLIDSYYGPKGIGYSMARVPIGGTDFSTHFYTYNELPVNDTKLTNFTLAYEDYHYKIPMIKQIQAASKIPLHSVATAWTAPEWMREITEYNACGHLRPEFYQAHADYHLKYLPLYIVATAWTAPEWMREITEYNACGHLRPEFYQTHADYHLKFIQHYAEQGVPIWAVTTGNEPFMGYTQIIMKGNCLGWWPETMATWLADNFGPTIRNNTDVLILTGDDQRFTIPLWEYNVMAARPEALQYMDGIAVHFYYDTISPAALLDAASQDFPGKFIIYTEACTGPGPFEPKKVIPGSWSRGEVYMNSVISNINSNVVGWIDWNLCLNPQGGPTWTENYVDSPIHVFAEDDHFEKQPMYYAMAHVAKFLVRGSYRIKTVDEGNVDDVIHLAAVTTDDTVVVVLANTGNSTAAIGIKLGDQLVDLSIEPKSFTTVELPNTFDESCKLETMVEKVPGTPVDVDYDADSITVTYSSC